MYRILDTGESFALTIEKRFPNGRAPPIQRPTLKDIAVRTELNVSTVSRVLNDDGTLRISPPKRAEVQRVARELDYVPDRVARSLRLRRHFNVGYVFCDAAGLQPMYGYLELPVHRVRIYALEERLSERGYLLSLMRLPLEYSAALEEKVLRRHLVDGLVYNGNAPSLEAAERLRQACFPVVLIDPFTQDDRSAEILTRSLSAVVADREAGIRLALEHLRARGHRAIALVSGKMNRRRITGYRRAVRDLGLVADPRLERLFDPPGDNLYLAREAGNRMTRALLESGVPFTAVQAGSDATAAGVVGALRQAGRRVPEDVAVMGYDDLEGLHGALFPEPFLSTVRDPNREMGLRAADLLLDQIERGGAPERVDLQPELVLRVSA